MLTQLRINNFAIVNRLTLDLHKECLLLPVKPVPASQLHWMP